MNNERYLGNDCIQRLGGQFCLLLRIPTLACVLALICGYIDVPFVCYADCESSEIMSSSGVAIIVVQSRTQHFQPMHGAMPAKYLATY